MVSYFYLMNAFDPCSATVAVAASTITLIDVEDLVGELGFETNRRTVDDAERRLMVTFRVVGMR